MNDLKIFIRSLFKYQRSLILNMVFNVFYVFSSAFSITLIAPFVSVLFGMVPPVETLPAFEFKLDWLLQAAYFYISVIQLRYGTMNALVVLAVFFVAVTLIANVFRYLSFFFLSNIRSGLLRDMRRDFYSRILTLPVGYFSEQKKGDLLSRVNNDVGEVERAVVASLQGAFMEPLFVILFTAGLFVINWRLSLTVLLALPAVMWTAGRVGSVLKKKSNRAQVMLGNMVSKVEEAVNGLRVIKSFNLIDFSQRDFERENKRYVKQLNGILRRRDLAGPLTEIMLIAVALGVMLFGGLSVINGRMNADMFILFVLLLVKVVSPAKHTVAAFFDIQKGRAALARVYAVLNAPADGSEDGKKDVCAFERDIVYDKVCFRYEDGEKEVLHHVDMRLEKGKTYAFVGASGAGKTTAADLLSRFYEPVSGGIKIDGTDIRQLKRSAVRNLVGTVSQIPFVWHDTVAENIAFGMENVSREEIEQAARKADAHGFITALPMGYDTVLGDNAVNLSGGQRQRIVIARAILKNAPVLVLDEATSALDTESEKEVQRAIEKLMEGRTAVIIAHRLSTVRRADKIFVFDNGCIVEEGTHEELMACGGTYAKYVSLQTL